MFGLRAQRLTAGEVVRLRGTVLDHIGRSSSPDVWGEIILDRARHLLPNNKHNPNNKHSPSNTNSSNGAKGRGPKTGGGRSIGALNCIVTGENLGKLEAIRHIAFDQLALPRLERIEDPLRQMGRDEVLEREADTSIAGIADDEVARALHRDHRPQEGSVIDDPKVFRTLRQDTRMEPPEPVGLARATQPTEPELPATVIVDEAVHHARRQLQDQQWPQRHSEPAARRLTIR